MSPTSFTDTATEQLNELDSRHSWHPFTQMQEYLTLARVQIQRGEGCWLYDIEGNRYLDTNASVWTNVHGHGDPELTQALKEQADTLAHATWLGLSHEPGQLLTEELIKGAPKSLTRVNFSDNGSNAIEIALKLSFQYWQLTGKAEKTETIHLEGAYHGDTFGTMAVSGSDRFHGRFKNWCYKSHRISRPTCHEYNRKVIDQNSQKSLTELENLLKENSEKIACLVMEPWVQGAAGMILQPKDYLKSVAKLCKAHGIHLILDEVFVSFGRCGVRHVCNEEGITPDFLCLAKGLSGGYLPLAATLTTENIYSAFLGEFHEDKAFFHGHTFTANPLACAVSLKSIQKLDTLIESGELESTIQYFGNQLEVTFAKHPNIAQLRQRGLAASIDLQQANGQPFNTKSRTGMKLCIAAREKGLLLRPLGDSILLVPPIVISSDEIDYLCENLNKTIQTLND